MTAPLVTTVCYFVWIMPLKTHSHSSLPQVVLLGPRFVVRDNKILKLIIIKILTFDANLSR